MTSFRCIPIETATADRFRDTGIDDRGNAVIRTTAESSAAAPCRHCLRYAAEGDTMLLGSYDLPRPRGIYWTPSPIFVHAEPCPRFDRADVVAPIVRANSLVSIRAYDGDDRCLYALGTVCADAGIDAPLLRALDDPETAFVNIHTARPGCLLCRVETLA